MGGVGKTALAVEAAHWACAKGWFPGGTLFVDLRGYDDDPVTADQAVLALLDALGVNGADLPPTATRRYDTYRTLLAEQRNRTLLILDNASDPAQFLPLLPGTDSHRVLITSRDRPDALVVRQVGLDTLVPDDSVALLARSLLEAYEEDDRPAQEPDALRELAEVCGHLPLALHIAGAELRRHRNRTVASLVTEIRRADDPAAVLDRGSPGMDVYGRSLVLRPVLETSYRRLPSDLARLLRFLALAPGAETSTELVAALTGLDTETSLSLLEDLAATHLVTSVRSTYGQAPVIRWRMHDLVRAFGMRVVESDAVFRDEGEAARKRVLEFYHRWVTAADDRMNWLPGMPEPERFADVTEALTWLDGERACLVGAVQWAREGQHADIAVKLAVRLTRFFDWRRYHDEWVTLAGIAQEAANRAGDLVGEVDAWDRLGMALREAGRPKEAIAAHRRSLDLLQTAGDDGRVASAWEGLGLALADAGRFEEAMDADIRARDLYRAAGDRRNEGNAWNHLGIALHAAGRVEDAIEALTRARDLFEAVEDRNRAGMAWNNLGVALKDADRLPEAIDAFVNACVKHREFGDWFREGAALWNLARAHEAAHHLVEARKAWLTAAEVFARANAPDEAAQARTRAAELPV